MRTRYTYIDINQRTIQRKSDRKKEKLIRLKNAFRTREKKADDAHGHRHETAGSFATGFDPPCPLRTHNSATGPIQKLQISTDSNVQDHSGRSLIIGGGHTIKLAVQ